MLVQVKVAYERASDIQVTSCRHGTSTKYPRTPANHLQSFPFSSSTPLLKMPFKITLFPSSPCAVSLHHILCRTLWVEFSASIYVLSRAFLVHIWMGSYSFQTWCSRLEKLRVSLVHTLWSTWDCSHCGSLIFMLSFWYLTQTGNLKCTIWNL